MDRAVLIAVDGDAAGLRDVETELLARYGRDYDVVCLGSAAQARRRLEELAEEGTPVALVLAAPVLAGGTGEALLTNARRLHPHAKRAPTYARSTSCNAEELCKLSSPMGILYCPTSMKFWFLPSPLSRYES